MEHSTDRLRPTCGGTSAPMEHALAKARATITAARERIASSLKALSASEQALRAVRLAGPAVSRADLRGSVVAYTRRLRSEGVAPEHALIEVRAAAREQLSPTLGPSAVRDSIDDVVRWGIEAYYDVGPARRIG